MVEIRRIARGSGHDFTLAARPIYAGVPVSETIARRASRLDMRASDLPTHCPDGHRLIEPNLKRIKHGPSVTFKCQLCLLEVLIEQFQKERDPALVEKTVRRRNQLLIRMAESEGCDEPADH